jgi:hypothetical protein
LQSYDRSNACWLVVEQRQTGDIKKGLMAGLGAYGGAGIGSALAASGF